MKLSYRMITAAQLREYIGRKVEWEHSRDRHRGTCLVSKGVLEEVRSRNLLISGEWRWWPDLENFKLID
jgi:hypothetical protein